MAGPFVNNPLSLPLTLSPLNSVPKKDLSKRRVISDLSFPYPTSVNDGIPKGAYLGDSFDLAFPSVDVFAARIREVGPSGMLFKKDLQRAYRQFRVDPGDSHLLGYQWKGSIYIDLALAMGVRSAAYLCQRVTSALSYIYTSMGYHLTNYIDDLAVCVPASVADTAYNTLSNLLKDLGVEEAVEKSHPPSKTMEFLGVQFSVTDMTMSVTQDRIQEIISLVDNWLFKRKATKRELQSLIGKLQFVAKCVRAGRIFISRLLSILPSLRKSNHRFHVNNEIKKDLFWWKSFLITFNGVTIIPDVIWSDPDALLSTDACLTSMGGHCGKEYFSCDFPSDILAAGHDINILELYTVMVAVKVWSSKLTNRRIQINCDNQASVMVINSGRTKNKVMLAILREIAFNTAKSNCQIKAVHIQGVNNRFSDLLSRAPRDNKANNQLQHFLDESYCNIHIYPEVFQMSNDW
jgi:hypothetical protein